MSSECLQSVFRVSSECVQSVFRVSSECVQSVFNIEVISSSSASSVSIIGIFYGIFNCKKSCVGTFLCALLFDCKKFSMWVFTKNNIDSTNTIQTGLLLFRRKLTLSLVLLQLTFFPQETFQLSAQRKHESKKLIKSSGKEF